MHNYHKNRQLCSMAEKKERLLINNVKNNLMTKILIYVQLKIIIESIEFFAQSLILVF